MRALLVSLPLVLFGCGSSDSGGTPPTTDTDSGTVADTAPADTKEAGGTSCTSARETAIGPVDKVSGGIVKVIDDTAGVKTVFIDATAGGISGGKTNPWVYVKLATGTRADLTDKQAFDSAEWDLALKRPIIHTNSGDAGPGNGGAKIVSKAFDAVTLADATGLKVETWFDAECTPLTDPTGSVKTTFDGWYAYDDATMKVTPKDLTIVVRAANGDLYKLAITTYYGSVSGGTSVAGANYIVKYAALK
jgi:hypothetical protein